MPGCMNLVFLVGNVGNDPSYREFEDGRGFASFALATDDGPQDSQEGSPKNTDWHRIIVYGKLANKCQAHLKKGCRVLVEGAVKTRSWVGEDGERNYITEVVAVRLLRLSQKAFEERLDEGSSQLDLL